ncbi:hypothetical protein BJX61DRAFT_488942 [Aspergillus egyptiacus]|nr:hypothetical protein BJX61DRAFT_488942 [Aspergillus egyptiacus]
MTANSGASAVSSLASSLFSNTPRHYLGSTVVAGLFLTFYSVHGPASLVAITRSGYSHG